VTDEGALAAGDFSSWLVDVEGAIRGERSAEVPCGACTACCTSSQFVHIGPDETDTLAHIPAELLFPAPRLPRGHVLLGYDERGHCPMLVDGKCSVYAHRPKTCRTYDCRIFAATGLEPDEDDQELIARRARRWRFGFPTETDAAEYDAVRAAAAFVREQPRALPPGTVPLNATQHAVLAVQIHGAFLGPGNPDAEAVRAEVRRQTATRSGR
jgi:uncharacterized protein